MIVGLGIILLLLVAVLLWRKRRHEGYSDYAHADSMLMSKRPDICSMYTNATDCKGACGWAAAIGMCVPKA
jgi:hypothetical protein